MQQGVVCWSSLIPPSEDHEPHVYLKEFINALTNFSVDDVSDRDLKGLKIRNTKKI